MNLKMTRYSAVAAWSLAVAMAVTPVLAVPASGPIQWTGAENGSSVTLYVDGQKATGGVHVRGGGRQGDVDLSGSGSGFRYTGTLRGTVARAAALSGTWTADLPGGSGTILLSISPASGQPFQLSLPLISTASYTTLQCSWLRGSATRKSKTGAAVALRAGDTLQLGDAIETAAGGAAVVVLADRIVVLMQEKSRIQIPDSAENRSGIQKVRATAGKVWFAVKKVQDGNHFQVETDEVVAAVRGTEFLVEVDDAGRTSLTTAEGEVGMNDLTGSRPTIPVPAGMVWHAPPRGARGGWGPGVPADLRRLAQDWHPLLREADRFWPLRRLNKREFWQERYREGGVMRPLQPEASRFGPRSVPQDRPRPSQDARPARPTAAPPGPGEAQRAAEERAGLNQQRKEERREEPGRGTRPQRDGLRPEDRRSDSTGADRRPRRPRPDDNPKGE